MTIGELLRSKSSAPTNSGALVVLENVINTKGSSTVFMPKDCFVGNIINASLSADVKNEVSAGIKIASVSANLKEQQYTANITEESLNGNITQD